MKVLAAPPLYPPASRVGSWLATHEFLRHLAAVGHDVIVTPLMGGCPGTLDGVEIRPWSEFSAELDRADVLVTHCGDTGRAHRRAVKAGVPSVRFFHGGELTMHGAARASLVVFNSEASAAASRWSVPSVVCRPAIDPGEFRTTPGDRVTLVNLSWAKGVRTFRAAAEALPEVEFLGVRGGYGSQRSIELPNVDTVPLTDDMRRDVYSRTRILLMPSDAETWGRVGVEAMCSGIPVIAHPTPGLRESLGDAGIFVDRDEDSAWVHEIRRLQDPDEWVEASRRALARVAELDHRVPLDRFAEAVESLVGVPA